jgi:peptide/nickel transport system substrate-binding protein
MRLRARGSIRGASAGALAIAVLAAAGCGDSVGPEVGAAGALPPPSGTLTVALPGPPGEVDPLLASDPSQLLLARQVYEPLVETLSGPYDDLRRVPGPALSVRSSSDHTRWRLRLRPGMSFQDGTRLDDAAVLANAARWRTTDAGRALLPGLYAADAPRPGLVRLFFNRSMPGLRQALAQPQLGIVSPAALSTPTGEGATLARPSNAGSGPFEIRERSGDRVVLARNATWWGTSRRLGPALDSIDLDYTAPAAARARQVRTGEAQMAIALTAAIAAALHHDPLITLKRVAGGTGGTALERSVRGVDLSGPTPVFSGAWLTTIGAG